MALSVDTAYTRTVPRRRNFRLEVVEALLGPLPSFSANRIRTEALRLTGVQVAHSALFWGFPKLVGPGDVCKRLRIGRYCGFNVGCYFGLDARIEIGEHVSVGHEVMFLTRTYLAGGSSQRAGHELMAPIVVEDGVWIAARCVVMPGVRIGAGAVIGASVVVSKDVAPNTLLTGSRTVSLARWR